MLVYIEFISRRPGIGLHEFHAVVGGGQRGWAGDYGDDRCVLNVGRSWRMGPEPEYLCAWYTPGEGIERIDEWERVFRSGDADAYEEPFRLAGRIDRAGCYDPLVEPVAGSKGRYYGEWFEPAADDGAVRAFYEQRAARHPELELNLLVRRIGKLGPDPCGLAVWWHVLLVGAAGIARDAAPDGPVRTVAAGLYSVLGKETL